MNPFHLRPHAARVRVAAFAVVMLLTGCMGMDVTSVRRVEAGLPSPGAQDGVVTGRIRFVVDGQPMAYNVMTRPHLSLYHHQRGVLMSSPLAQEDGTYRWQLPAGDYSVAVIFGGMSPSRQRLLLPTGSEIRVSGIVNPGAAFRLPAGAAVDLGDLVVDIESRPAGGLLTSGERVFGRLRDVRVEPSTEAAAAPALRLVEAAPRTTTEEASTIHPAVLAPLLPLLIR